MKNWSKSITLLDKKIHLFFEEAPFYQDDSVLFFGFPINLLEDSKFLYSQKYCMENLKGYWVRIEFNKDSFSMTQDLFGGHRIYYTVKENSFYFTDNWSDIIDTISENGTLDSFEYDYWKKHGYTTGASTFIKELKKVPAFHTILVNNNGHEIKNQFPFYKIVNKPSLEELQQGIHKDLTKSMRLVKSEEARGIKIILLFSGGLDSSLLASYMIEAGIKFTPIFLLSSMTSASEKSRAIDTAKRLNINIKILEIDCLSIDNDFIERFVNRQLFDRHESKLHYFGVKEIYNNFGKEVMIINGQTSDSIISLGPSEKSLIGYMKRMIIHRPQSLISKILTILFSLKKRARLKLPKNNFKRLLALADEYNYIRLIDKNSSYFDKGLKNKVERLINEKAPYFNNEMTVKIFTFIQGSDNQIVLNSNRHFGISRVFMPFATPKIVFEVLKYKDINKEIFYPKEVLKRLFEKSNSWNPKKEDISKTVLKLLGRIPKKNSVEIDTYFNSKAKKLIQKCTKKQ